MSDHTGGDFTGLRAIVTGAGSGIGLAVATHLSARCLLYTSPSPRDS